MNWLASLLGRPRSPTTSPRRRLPIRVIRARYDAAQTTDENRRHWALADGLSADAAASPMVRRILRNRCRHEVANNSYARGIVLTLANDSVGTGPRLQLTGVSGEDARQAERAFADWARAIDLPEKLRCLRVSQAEDGEGFGLLTSNPGLPSPVTLDLRLVEADQVTTPGARAPTGDAVDGIVFDPSGNPVEYHVLRAHPGSGTTFALDYDRVPAPSVRTRLLNAIRPGAVKID